jgi:hypothetical protein
MMFANQFQIAPGLGVPAPWCAALHAIVHWQIQHDGFLSSESRGVRNIKCGLDVARYLTSEKVDWVALAAYATSVGIKDEFKAGMNLAAQMFGIELKQEAMTDRTGPGSLAFYRSARLSPEKLWIIRRKAKISAHWRCERVLYRIQLRTRNQIMLAAGLWLHRFLRLPIIAFLWTDLAVATLFPTLIANRGRTRSALK